jgi:hypothetical protein
MRFIIRYLMTITIIFIFAFIPGLMIYGCVHNYGLLKECMSSGKTRFQCEMIMKSKMYVEEKHGNP